MPGIKVSSFLSARYGLVRTLCWQISLWGILIKENLILLWWMGKSCRNNWADRERNHWKHRKRSKVKHNRGIYNSWEALKSIVKSPNNERAKDWSSLCVLILWTVSYQLCLLTNIVSHLRKPICAVSYLSFAQTTLKFMNRLSFTNLMCHDYRKEQVLCGSNCWS